MVAKDLCGMYQVIVVCFCLTLCESSVCVPSTRISPTVNTTLQTHANAPPPNIKPKSLPTQQRFACTRSLSVPLETPPITPKIPPQTVRQTFGSPSVLSGCFNVNPLAVRSTRDGKAGAGGGVLGLAIPRVDTEGLDAVFAGLLGLGARVVKELWSSVEEVRV